MKMISRHTELCIAQTAVPLPCFFPSVSSVKTNLTPVDYIKLLTSVKHPLFLVSAYDIADTAENDISDMRTALQTSQNNGTAILMDSGEL